ncbi:MAG: hypothetical protein COT90_05165 [Candidatus Diapherotrites archaeon CG10_big_fil_rev_8_21_14_0_10_31_34]|nr:MAG: hypothetical protein COT90_05165 [Candidatus Diapherotrites archaeon CG10_big_fil_rev_8_21_14_0_10_31_34]
MATTIQISKTLQTALKKKKMYENESYEELIWNLLEDSMKLNEETKKDIKEARADVKKGKFYTLEQVEKEAGL